MQRLIALDNTQRRSSGDSSSQGSAPQSFASSAYTFPEGASSQLPDSNGRRPLFRPWQFSPYEARPGTGTDSDEGRPDKHGDGNDAGLSDEFRAGCRTAFQMYNTLQEQKLSIEKTASEKKAIQDQLDQSRLEIADLRTAMEENDKAYAAASSTDPIVIEFKRAAGEWAEKKRHLEDEKAEQENEELEEQKRYDERLRRLDLEWLLVFDQRAAFDERVVTRKARSAEKAKELEKAYGEAMTRLYSSL